MGCGASKSPPTEGDAPTSEARAKDHIRSSNLIKRMLEDQIEEQDKEQKLLLLGAGESGKSTIFKQMHVLTSGYTKEERQQFRWIVQRNVLDGIRTLLQAAEDFGLALAECNEERADRILTWEGENLNPKLAEDIGLLWKDPAIVQCFVRRAEFQLGDGAQYFLGQLDRISEPNYLPTDDDVLHSRVRTSGVVNKKFTLNNVDFQMFDVGGQRAERRKWIQYFDHANVIIFVAALSEYNQVLAEDNSKNRLQEALDLFQQIVCSEWFKDTTIMIFLNKKDLFAEKIKTIDPKTWFPDYQGGCDYTKAERYFKEQFEKRAGIPPTPELDPEDNMPAQPRNRASTMAPRNRTSTMSTVVRNIFTYTTCATDTGNIKFVFDGIMEKLRMEIMEDFCA